MGWMVLKELRSIKIYFEIKNKLEEEKRLYREVQSSNVCYLHLFMV